MEHPISEAALDDWSNHRLTKQFFLELAIEYFSEIDSENTVVGSIVHAGKDNGIPISGYRSDPVAETAINCAISSGKIQVLDALMTWTPDNLDAGDADDE